MTNVLKPCCVIALCIALLASCVPLETTPDTPAMADHAFVMPEPIHDEPESEQQATSAGSAVEDSPVFEAVTLTALCPMPDLPPEIDDEGNAVFVGYDDNAQTAWVREQTGINLLWTYLPRDHASAALSTIMASDELPDLLIGCPLSRDDVRRYAEQRLLLPVDGYVDNLLPSFDKAMEDAASYGVTMDRLRVYDERVYALPVIDYALSDKYQTRMWYYEPWLSALGFGIPLTADDLYDVATAMLSSDPNHNERRDEIPILSCAQDGYNAVDFLLNAFCYYDATQVGLYNDEGTIRGVLDTDAYRDGLRYLTRLYAEGLINKDAFTMDERKLQQALRGTEAIAGFLCGVDPADVLPNNAPIAAHMRLLPPLKGADGACYTPNAALDVTYGYAITTACKTPAAALRLADFMYGVPYTLTAVTGGVEGRGWAWSDGGRIGMDGLPAVWQRLHTKLTSDDAWERIGVYNHTALRASRALTPGERDHDAEWATYDLFARHYKPADHNGLLPYVYEDVEAFSQIDAWAQPLRNFVERTQVEFITGKRNLENDWDAYIDELRQTPYAQLIDLYGTIQNIQNIRYTR